MDSTQVNSYKTFTLYYGDIHNHCDLSYGHGSLDDALYNARLQLDFTSVTVHAVWPDLPTDDPELAYLVDYHKKGFEKAQANWAGYLESIETHNKAGQFVTFPSFEWHSIEHGDYCVYYKHPQNKPIIDAPTLEALRQRLRELDGDSFLIPHHIGYRQGSRGINWCTFSKELSPVAEIFSFHGLSESSEGPYPYFHSMGPRHEQSTAHYGWQKGNLFGVIGSTDHHNAFPGSYGYGRAGVWAEELTREGIWQAIKHRRTYALTGDRIDLKFALNEHPMGAVCPPDENRSINIQVIGGDAIDTIDVLHNNRVIHRESLLPVEQHVGLYKIFIEMGWGERDNPFDWDVSVAIDGGDLLDVEPRLRGYSPTATPKDNQFAYSSLTVDDDHVHLKTKTRANLSLHTPATEGFCLEIDGTAQTCLHANINGTTQVLTLADLMSGTRTFYTGGFVSPAICFHRAVPQAEYSHRFALNHSSQSLSRDWYTVRVRQHNGQYAWSSPIWVDGSNNDE